MELALHTTYMFIGQCVIMCSCCGLFGLTWRVIVGYSAVCCSPYFGVGSIYHLQY